MNFHKKIYSVLFTLIFISSAVYYFGCASAESTTGKLAFQQKDYEKAEAELKKGIAIDKTDAESWYMLGYSQIELGKIEDAKKSFAECKGLSSAYNDQIVSLWVEKFNQGAGYFKEGVDSEARKDTASAMTSYGSALKAFEASYAIIPDSLKSLKAIGETYLALGNREKAKDVFNEILSKSNNPKDAEKVAAILFDAGLGMMQMNNYSDAAATFKGILGISALPKDDPYYETSSYNVALALAKQGEAMRIADENSDFKGKFTEALVYLEPLSSNLKTKDLEPKVLDLMVSVYANLGMNDKAQDALNKKKQIKGDN